MKIARTFPVDVVDVVDGVVPEPVDVLDLQWCRRAPMILTRSPAAGGFAPLPKNTLALVNV